MAQSASGDHFRRANIQAALAKNAGERIERALELGRLGIAIFASANGLSVDRARALLQQRQGTKRRSRDPSNP
jgi:hypothetical protein